MKLLTQSPSLKSPWENVSDDDENEGISDNTAMCAHTGTSWRNASTGHIPLSPQTQPT